MKYFRWNEWDIKWKLTWDNYILYISSIPKQDPIEDAKPKLETKDAADIF